MKLVMLALAILALFGGVWFLARKKKFPAAETAAPDNGDGYATALSHYDAGRRDEAEAAFRALLKTGPRHAEASYKLGNLLKDTGRAGEAEAAYRQALAAKPDYPDAWLNLGNLLVETGRLAEAEAAYRQALGAKPDFVLAYNNLGNLLQFSGRIGEAEAAFRQALRHRPEFPEALNNLGILLIEARRFAEAEPIFRELLRKQPDDVEILNNLGTLLDKSGQPSEAEAVFRDALRIQPDHAEALNNLGILLIEARRFAEAEPIFRQLLRKQPDDVEILNNLGVLLDKSGRTDEAESVFRDALRIQPDYAEAHNNLATLFHTCSRFDEAESAYAQAFRLDPTLALEGQSLLKMLHGDFEQGFAYYRLQYESARRRPRQTFPQPLWDGQTLAGKTLFAYCEPTPEDNLHVFSQGLGDSLQFFRYLPLLAASGGRLLVECQPPLARLFKANLPAGTAFIEDRQALPPFDVHCPVLSLPMLFNTRLDTIPAEIPYLKPPTDAVAACPALQGAGLKVGVVWAGNPKHNNDHNRSMDFALLEPVFAVAGITWVILQKERRPQGFKALAAQRGWLDPMGGVRDFADTAAIVEQLDLVLGVDTSVIHLAGALGKPVWLLLPKVPDWRWLLDRDDNPWYPTMRLFRQKKAGQWPEVIQRVAEDLQTLGNEFRKTIGQDWQ